MVEPRDAILRNITERLDAARAHRRVPLFEPFPPASPELVGVPAHNHAEADLMSHAAEDINWLVLELWNTELQVRHFKNLAEDKRRTIDWLQHALQTRFPALPPESRQLYHFKETS